MTVAGAKRYLKDHLRVQLREIPIAIQAFLSAPRNPEVGVGFWMLLRSILCPVNFLGALYKGEDRTENAIAFVVDYVGRRGNKQRYVDLFPLVFFQFRHGLIHTAMPKVFERADDGKVVGWWVRYTDDPAKHLAVELGLVGTGQKGAYVVLRPDVLYEDVFAALNLYISDFDNPLKTESLFANFKKGFLEEMATVFRSADLDAGEAMQAQVEQCLRRI